MYQLICASRSHSHYWHEVGMLKVPVQYRGVIILKTSIISKSTRAGCRAPEYAVPTSRLLQDLSMAHRHVISNSGKRRSKWQREFCGGGTFTAVRIHTAVVGFRSFDRSAQPLMEIEQETCPPPTSRLLQDPSLAHRQGMSNLRKRRGTWQREFCGCGTFTAERIHTAVVV